MKPRKTVIVITPSESLRNEYALQMDVWGYRVLRPGTMDEAMTMVKAEQPDAVLCDRMADGMIQQLAAAAPERTGFVLVTEATRKVQGFNAILRDRIKAAATRKPGPKKGSASVANPAISTGTHGILALLVALVVSQFAVSLNGQIKPHAAATNGKVMLHVVPFGIARQAVAFTQIQDFLSGGGVVASGSNRGSRIGLKEMCRPTVSALEVHQHAVDVDGDYSIPVVGAVVHAHAAKLSAPAVDTQNAPQPVQGTTTGCVREGCDGLVAFEFSSDLFLNISNTHAELHLFAAHEADYAVCFSRRSNGFNCCNVPKLTTHVNKIHVASGGMSVSPERLA